MATKPIEFANEIGQIIQPGDHVITVSAGFSHNIRTTAGVYVGLSVSGKPQVRVGAKRFGYWNAEGKDVGWKNRLQPGIEREHRQYERITTLPRGRVYRLG